MWLNYKGVRVTPHFYQSVRSGNLEESYKFYENKSCEYFPCHNINLNKIEGFNCLWCYCPLHNIDDCGGSYEVLENDVKDCSKCLLPHIPDNYDYIINKLWDKK